MSQLNNNLWIGIRRQQEREIDRSKPGKGPFWRKQENAAKHGVRLGGLRARVSDGDAAQISYVPNGKKG